MNLLANRQVAIIGASPTGLLLAMLLQQRGAAVTVCERNAGPEARVWGGIRGQRALGSPAHPNLCAAIAAYERTMYAYAHAGQQMTARAERSIHGEQGKTPSADRHAEHIAWNALLMGA